MPLQALVFDALGPDLPGGTLNAGGVTKSSLHGILIAFFRERSLMIPNDVRINMAVENQHLGIRKGLDLH